LAAFLFNPYVSTGRQQQLISLRPTCPTAEALTSVIAFGSYTPTGSADTDKVELELKAHMIVIERLSKGEQR